MIINKLRIYKLLKNQIVSKRFSAITQYRQYFQRTFIFNNATLVKIQLISFSLATLGAFFGVRPFMLKYAHKKNDNIKTNIDALVGKEGRVITTIDNALNQGRVMVEGDDWKAEAENNEVINQGEKIEVLKVNSTILTVKSISKN